MEVDGGGGNFDRAGETGGPEDGEEIEDIGAEDVSDGDIGLIFACGLD